MKVRAAFLLAIAVWIAAAMPPAALAQATPDLAFGRFIALIRGHLLTGDELAAQRQWDGASQHFGFPREEIYGIIRQQIIADKIPQFDGALKMLVRAAKARDLKPYQKARAQVESALAAADANLKARAPNWPRFVAGVAIEVLKTAPDEYDDAVSKGRIVRPIGYQTARGFVLQAERMVESVAGEFTGANAAALSDIRAGFDQLKQALIALNAPKQAAIDYAAFVAIVSKIELAAGKLT